MDYKIEYYIGEVNQLRDTICAALAALKTGTPADVAAAIEILKREKL